MRPARFARVRRVWAWLREHVFVDLHPACPICGQVYYIKTMPLHLGQHHPDDPDVVAWQQRGAPSKWTPA